MRHRQIIHILNLEETSARWSVTCSWGGAKMAVAQGIHRISTRRWVYNQKINVETQLQMGWRGVQSRSFIWVSSGNPLAVVCMDIWMLGVSSNETRWLDALAAPDIVVFLNYWCLMPPPCSQNSLRTTDHTSPHASPDDARPSKTTINECINKYYDSLEIFQRTSFPGMVLQIRGITHRQRAFVSSPSPVIFFVSEVLTVILQQSTVSRN